jgi:SAM-dependent methyltransferase
MHTLRCLYRGQSLLRIRMNQTFADHVLSGKVLDVGGGHNPDYFQYFERREESIEMIDGSSSPVNFETDQLPYADGAFDTLVLANVLEHVYNHQFLLGETHRVLAGKGILIGFVPFWTGYHPDPHDYFRYTDEALARLLPGAGFVDVSITAIGGGPVLANFNTIVLSIPRILRPIAYVWYSAFDALFVRLRPKSAARNPLGYVFRAARP